MTLLRIAIFKSDPSGVDIPAKGQLWFAPSTRRHVEDPTDHIVLPAPFKVVLGSDFLDEDGAVVTAGEPGIAWAEVDPTDVPNWAWTVVERTNKGRGTTWVEVPDQALVEYADLVALDPETLDPEAPLLPAWVADLAAHAADTTAVHGITNTANLLTTATGAGGVLSGTLPNPGFAVDMVEQGELDADVAALVDGAGPTDTALAAGYTSRISSPRGGQRVTSERHPRLVVDYQFPNAMHDHMIVLVEDGGTMWSVGQDSNLRKSTDGGLTWGAKVYYPGSAGRLAKLGMFYKTTAGSYLTTYHPYDNTAPKIMRSTNAGVAWTDVVAAQTDVDYLGPTSICQDPVTGALYLTEYVTVGAATKATWKISVSTDDGATWTTFHTFQRDAVANPTTAVRHGHGAQWDPVGSRVWFLCGDTEQAAGLYRVNAGGTDVEAVVTNSQLNTAGGFYAGAVGVMFFPNYIAWGVDQVSNSGLLRMARTQIGQPSPAVTKITDLQSTAFYTVRTDPTTHNEWLMVVSNENTAGGRLDNAIHIYRVADDAATIDEVLTIASNRDDASFAWAYPVSTPLQAATTGAVWIATSIPSPLDSSVINHGIQFRARLAWGAGVTMSKNDGMQKLWGPEITVSTGNENLTQNTSKFFGITECPPRMTRLYILETNVTQISGSGFPVVDVYDQTNGVILKDEGGVTDMTWQHRSRRAALTEAGAPYLVRSAGMSAGRQIRFRLREGNVGATEAVGSITYAWGF